ncbi:MAG: OmpA family protein [Gammaproteobacteria bacterium]|nr:OmpA family protein [Gammaproteobacteria bacterium]
MPSSEMKDMLGNEDNGNSWIVTYADMMTLILVFFILLYTLSSFEDEAYRGLVDSVQVLDGEGNRVSIIDHAISSGRDPAPLQAIENMLGLKPPGQIIELVKPVAVSELESMIESTDLSDSIELAYEGDQIFLQIDGRLLFPSAKAELKDDAKIIFANLSQMFRKFADYRVAIRGHTDDRDIETVQFPSNWELSAVRATTVLRYFISQGIDPERMTATGYADFIPLVENSSPENRARNRRVEFVLEKETKN